MVNVVYKSLTALQPVELKYQYYRDEPLQSKITSYEEGYNFFTIEGLDHFEDIAINKGSCFVLTTAVNLSSVFTNQKTITVGQLPGTINLQPRNSSIYYAGYSSLDNTIKSTSLTATNFFIYPINNTDEIEIRIEDKYLQVDKNYPYTVRADNTSLGKAEINRQRFFYTYQSGLITLKTLTQEGFRYLAFNNDNTLRATGVMFNNSILNDYVFKAKEVTSNELETGFIPDNNWITYFQDIENQSNNKTVAINKNFNNVPVNYLIDFPVEAAIETGEVTINIANLKTGFTPAGGPAPIDNSYNEEITTTN